MRLLRTDALEVVEIMEDNIPPYAILSHTWGKEEVTLDDVKTGIATSRAGYAKLEGAREQAKKDGFKYIWIDTCCIDKSSSAELSEAINSMFQWYAAANVCYAYLSDVGDDDSWKASSLDRSRWFYRGWTLQELLAPPVVYFYTSGWREIGSRHDLRGIIASITRIDENYFITGDLTRYSAAQKMSWAAHRRTTRVEDIAYCLLGLFDINMPLLYGEGHKAFRRLQEEILRRTQDDSLFTHCDDSTFFASAPASFNLCCNIMKGDLEVFRTLPSIVHRAVSIASNTIEITLLFLAPRSPIGSGPTAMQTHEAVLNCGRPGLPYVLQLKEESPGVFRRQRLATYIEVPSDSALNSAFARTVILRSNTGQEGSLWSWRGSTLDPSGGDAVIVDISQLSASSFALKNYSPGEFEFHSKDSKIGSRRIVLAGATPGHPWFLFCSKSPEKRYYFSVLLSPTRDSINAELFTNVGPHYSDTIARSGLYMNIGQSTRATTLYGKGLRAVQGIGAGKNVTVGVDSRKRADGWCVTITVDPLEKKE